MNTWYDYFYNLTDYMVMGCFTEGRHNNVVIGYGPHDNVVIGYGPHDKVVIDIDHMLMW
jgi:hypothetical protein